MNTKNIFRTLFLAVAIVMGVGNVNADEHEVNFQGNYNNNTNNYIADKSEFSDIKDQSIFRIYVSNVNEGYWKLYICGGLNEWNNISWAEPYFEDWQKVDIASNNLQGYVFNGEYFEFTCTSTTVSVFKTYGLFIDSGNTYTIDRITYIDSAVEYEVTTIWGPSSQILNWYDWNNGHVDFSTSCFSEANVGDIIRIKGIMGNSENWFNVQLVDMYVPNWNNNNTTGQWTSEEDGYIDAIISSDMLNQLKNNQTCALTGYNFTATEIQLVRKVTGDVGDSYSVSIFDNITNGTVTVNPTKAKEGATVTLTINPNTGYELETISVTDGDNQAVTLEGSGNTRTFTMPASDVTVSATFKASVYTVSVSSASNGSITANTTSAKMGDTVTLTITPNSDYELGSISVVDGSGNAVQVDGTGNTRTFIMPASDVTVTGSFVKERTYVPATVTSSTGYATFCSTKPLDFSGMTTLKAYYAASVSDTEVTFKQITGTVAAGTGLLLKGDKSEQPYQILVAETGTSYADNLLKGGPQKVNAANLYVLVEKDGVAKFADTAGNAATVPEGKAYLEAPTSNSRVLSFSFDGEATNIGVVTTAESEPSAIYNLQGQRVTTMGKGLYIINGKKVMIK